MKVLISDKIHEAGIKILEENGFKLEKKYSLNQEELSKEIQNFEAIIIRSRTKLRAEILIKAKKLRIIVRAGVGLDNVDLEKAEELGITVSNTPKAPSVSVAELTMGLILSLVRHIPNGDKTTHCGEWCKNEYMGNVLKGKKIGLIGFGNIGTEVAKKAAAFEMDIGIYDVDKDAKKKASALDYDVYDSVDELIKYCQIISLHIPATVKTENTIDTRRLSLMNEKTLLINTARGNLIDEKALVKAIEEKRIGGAALDVYREEPLKNMDLCNCEGNLILTPHIGSQTEETQIEASISAAKKIIKYFNNFKKKRLKKL